MPKTLPAIYWRGSRVPQTAISRIGLAAALLSNLLLVILLAVVPS